MKTFEQDFKANPSFNTVLNLSNTTFDPNNVVGGRMATEDQVKGIEERYTALEARRDYCCRDITIWKTYTRIVNSSGNVISNFSNNVVVGTARRGYPFTVTFTPKWDPNIYTRGSGWNGNVWMNGIAILIPAGTTNASTAVEADQAKRESVDIILNTTTSPKSGTGTSGNTPMSDVTNLQTQTKRVTYNTTQVFPLQAVYQNNTDVLGTVYIQDDNTLAIDITDRRVYGGMEGYYPNSPRFLCILCTQFVLL